MFYILARLKRKNSYRGEQNKVSANFISNSDKCEFRTYITYEQVTFAPTKMKSKIPHKSKLFFP